MTQILKTKQQLVDDIKGLKDYLDEIDLIVNSDTSDGRVFGALDKIKFIVDVYKAKNRTKEPFF